MPYGAESRILFLTCNKVNGTVAVTLCHWQPNQPLTSEVQSNEMIMIIVYHNFRIITGQKCLDPGYIDDLNYNSLPVFPPNLSIYQQYDRYIHF